MTVTLRDGDLVLEPTSGSAEFTGFAIVLDGERVGTVALRTESSDICSIRWNSRIEQPFLVARALRLALQHAFVAMAVGRVEVRLPVGSTRDIRAASMGGLRREGIIRLPGERPDQLLMARLVDDPPSDTSAGFTAILNAGLPTKRVIGQGLVRDERGRVLLCELTYKREWDLPGGVIEVGEAPSVGLVRELEEELGITVEVHDLITVNWLPAWRGWDDACIFLFDLGVVNSSITQDMSLQPSEIKAVHWCEPDEVRDRATAAAIELLAAIETGHVPTYREAPKAAE
ncbi:NUDIX domain-containing protein [Aeromicrobium wangtongii]|uniref:NUDIX hydrolase n=1 Tax=Aeromicrobium wangtongii TaxID=2969247 RepID=A0ABY5M7W9_9ACTN|nr:NUDIX hydrolase [Aeromicrobium wangtongii]MCD9199209.1 NUDIX hydrolase [Aeromicrobium wangtongii]UUP12763.1 NUDIX hydrolase [Aeromicrobium wangtongii]